MKKAWLVIYDWRNKHPDLLDDYNCKVFLSKYNAEYCVEKREKRENTVIIEIELPSLALSYHQEKFNKSVGLANIPQKESTK